ncbi:Aromatic-L-amino-acid decarboxylase [Acorus gramineus]|uniref:Aromatic-L-amino-acid decarboxylase n=1 Tax=Acorus gramineus TaxID=55184 RepID=A0AAV9A9B9_ACOGR|nr:Aromatic-L-amino-acid decarboxylase [Acorus gramineus]
MGSLETTTPSSPLHEPFNPLDIDDFRTQAHKAVDFIADYYASIESRPVLPRVDPGYLRKTLSPPTPLTEPTPFDSILSEIETHIIPGMTHWLSPNFFAYFPATVSTAGFLGEMLSSSFNSVGFNWLASPASTELESIVMDWLASLLKLPQQFTFSGSGGGVLQGTTSEAILCTLVAARERAIEKSSSVTIQKLVVYGSDQTHSTFAKACKIAGISPSNIRTVPTSADTEFALSPELLKRQMEVDVAAGLVPLYLCATVGTTSSNAVDPVGRLADVARDYGVWVHVDAAYAGSACICPEFRQYLDGVEKVDSLSLSPHKWLLTYLDCCCLWVRNRDLLISALATDPEYLKNRPSESGSVVDYKDWQVGLGRRFRALRLWMVLKMYGVANLQSHIRSDVGLAMLFEGHVRGDRRFEVVVPRRFGLVCFRLKGVGEGLNRRVLEEVNRTGMVYMTHTVVGGEYVMRFAVGATLTEERHVVAAWEIIRGKAEELLMGEMDSL